jgi:hypothetical protein
MEIFCVLYFPVLAFIELLEAAFPSRSIAVHRTSVLTPHITTAAGTVGK